MWSRIYILSLIIIIVYMVLKSAALGTAIEYPDDPIRPIYTADYGKPEIVGKGGRKGNDYDYDYAGYMDNPSQTKSNNDEGHSDKSTKITKDVQKSTATFKSNKKESRLENNSKLMRNSPTDTKTGLNGEGNPNYTQNTHTIHKTFNPHEYPGETSQLYNDGQLNTQGQLSSNFQGQSNPKSIGPNLRQFPSNMQGNPLSNNYPGQAMNNGNNIGEVKEKAPGLYIIKPYYKKNIQGNIGASQPYSYPGNNNIARNGQINPGYYNPNNNKFAWSAQAPGRNVQTGPSNSYSGQQFKGQDNFMSLNNNKPEHKVDKVRNETAEKEKVIAFLKTLKHDPRIVYVRDDDKHPQKIIDGKIYGDIVSVDEIKSELLSDFQSPANKTGNFRAKYGPAFKNPGNVRPHTPKNENMYVKNIKPDIGQFSYGPGNYDNGIPYNTDHVQWQQQNAPYQNRDPFRNPGNPNQYVNPQNLLRQNVYPGPQHQNPETQKQDPYTQNPVIHNQNTYQQSQNPNQQSQNLNLQSPNYNLQSQNPNIQEPATQHQNPNQQSPPAQNTYLNSQSSQTQNQNFNPNPQFLPAHQQYANAQNTGSSPQSSPVQNQNPNPQSPSAQNTNLIPQNLQPQNQDPNPQSPSSQNTNPQNPPAQNQNLNPQSPSSQNTNLQNLPAQNQNLNPQSPSAQNINPHPQSPPAQQLNPNSQIPSPQNTNPNTGPSEQNPVAQNENANSPPQQILSNPTQSTPASVGVDYNDIPGWIDMGIPTPSTTTTRATRPPTTTKPAPSTPSPLILNAKKVMSEKQMGFFTGYLYELFRLVATKEYEPTSELFMALKITFDKLLDQGALEDMGNPAQQALRNALIALVGWGPEQIQPQLQMARLMLDQRQTILEEDIRTIVNVIDAAYTIQEGDALLQTLVDVNDFPASEPALEVTKRMVDAFLQPYWKTPPGNRAKLFEMINMALERRDKYDTRRHNKYDKGYIDSQDENVSGDKYHTQEQNNDEIHRSDVENNIFLQKKGVKDSHSNDNHSSLTKIYKQFGVINAEHRLEIDRRFYKSRINSTGKSKAFKISERDVTENKNKQTSKAKNDDGKKKRDKTSKFLNKEMFANQNNKIKNQDRFTTNNDIFFEINKQTLVTKALNRKRTKQTKKDNSKDDHSRRVHTKEHHSNVIETTAPKLKTKPNKYDRLVQNEYNYEKSLRNRHKDHDISVITDNIKTNRIREKLVTVAAVTATMDVKKGKTNKEIAETVVKQTKILDMVYDDATNETSDNFFEDEYSYNKNENHSENNTQNNGTDQENGAKSKYLDTISRTTNDYHNFRGVKKTIKKKKIARKKKNVIAESSYSDEENELKTVLADAIRHSDFVFKNFRQNDDLVVKKGKIKEQFSYSDEEVILKNNIYKVFGYNPDLND